MSTPEEIEAARLDPRPPQPRLSISFTQKERDRALAALDRAGTNVRQLQSTAFAAGVPSTTRLGVGALLDLEDVRRFILQEPHPALLPEGSEHDLTLADILAREG